MKHVLLTTDFSEPSNAAFDVAHIQLQPGDRLTLVSVVPDWEVPPTMFEFVPIPEQMDQYRDEMVAKSDERLKQLGASFSASNISVSTRAVLSSRSAAQEICDIAREQNCDMIIMASRGHGAVASLILGSTVQRVLTLAPCPVLVVPTKPTTANKTK